MSDRRIKHVFPGGNTSLGFFSYYDNILSQEEARRIFVIKGGPGTGKSTYMKKVADEIMDRGYEAEFLHCSSDNNSIDGVVFPKIKVALVDGTAPHVVDPKNPGAVDEIIHLGDFWDEDGIMNNKEALMKDNREVGRNFQRGYRYLKAAYSIYEDNEVIRGWALDNSKVNSVTQKVIDEVFEGEGIAVNEGRQRKLFATAITPNGLKHYLDSILTTETVYQLKGECGTKTEKMLEKIRDAASERGYYTEAYYCALNPYKIEHLVIPGKNVAFTTANNYHEARVKVDVQIDFNEFLDKDILNEYSSVLEYNKLEFDTLLYKAISTIGEAKKVHDTLEMHYVHNMDFEAITRSCESITARILEYANEFE